MVGEPLVPDRRAVLLHRPLGQRPLPHPGPLAGPDPAAHVAQVVVDPVVDLVLHPDRARLGEPGVAFDVLGGDAVLEHVVVLVGERHLEVAPGLRPRIVEAAVVVVEDEVGAAARRGGAVQPGFRRVGRGVAEDLLPGQFGQVDVGLVVAAAAGPVAERRRPAEHFVLDVVDVFGDREDALDVVGDAVAVAVGAARRVDPRRRPSGRRSAARRPAKSAASATSPQGSRLGRIPGSPGWAARAAPGSATRSVAAAAAEMRKRDRIRTYATLSGAPPALRQRGSATARDNPTPCAWPSPRSTPPSATSTATRRRSPSGSSAPASRAPSWSSSPSSASPATRPRTST